MAARRVTDPGVWWTEAWSPVTGCTPAGAGCDHCWARAMIHRFRTLHNGSGGEEAFSHPLCHPDRLDKPLHWRKPRVVLVSMLGDLFHEQVTMEFAHRVLERAWCVNFDRLTVHLSEPHRFCFLTKRPRRAVEIFGQWHRINAQEGLADATGLMLMASVWDQPSADAASAAFSRLPPGVRWGLHCEPMLGPVRIDCSGGGWRIDGMKPAGLSWVACGGENGPSARPMDPQWAISLREQCRAAGVPFWFKGPGSAHRATTTVIGDVVALNQLEQTREVPW